MENKKIGPLYLIEGPFLYLKTGPLYYRGGRYKVQLKFGRCTLFFRNFTVVPYRRPLSEKFSKPCTL